MKALNTDREKSMGRPSRNASAAMAHTAFTGVPVTGFSADHTPCKGTPRSRANDHSILNRQYAQQPDQAIFSNVPVRQESNSFELDHL